MDSTGLIEFEYEDGRVVTSELSSYTSRRVLKGDRIEHDDTGWLMYDRVDRSGVTVHLFTPETSDRTTEPSRARTRHRGGS
jgi:hypothetical protein